MREKATNGMYFVHSFTEPEAMVAPVPAKLEERLRVERDAAPVERTKHAVVGVAHGGAVVGAAQEEAGRSSQETAVGGHAAEAQGPEAQGSRPRTR
jgi:hypothetical protein